MEGIEQRRRAALRRLGLATVVLVLAALGAAALLWWRSDAPPVGGSAAPVMTTAVPSSGATEPAEPAAVPDLLPPPARVVDGIPVGYPHTTPGAVSAAAHYAESADVLAPDTVVARMQVIADPKPDQIGNVAGVAIRSAQERRHELGLPKSGVSSAADYVAVQVRGYRVVATRPDQVDVWLLARETSVVAGVQREQSVYTIPTALTWTRGDWKLAYRTLSSAPEAAVPDSAEAAEKGWTTVAYAQ